MKHLLITIVLAVFVATRVGAETVTVNGLTYLLVNQEAAVIAGHDWVGELVIPSEISYNGQSFTVSMIYCEAFTYCETLTRVTIPKTIREIMNYIFAMDLAVCVIVVIRILYILIVMNIVVLYLNKKKLKNI